MPTRGQYSKIPIIMADYETELDYKLPRQWFSGDDGSLYYVKSDGETVISLYDVIIGNHEENGTHTNLNIADRVVFDKPFKIKIDGDVLADEVEIRQNVDEDGNPVINILNTKFNGTLNVSQGGTGATSLDTGAIMKKAGDTVMSSGILPVAFGGTGSASLPAGILMSDGTKVSSVSKPLTVANGGTGATKFGAGLVYGNGTNNLSSRAIYGNRIIPGQNTSAYVNYIPNMSTLQTTVNGLAPTNHSSGSAAYGVATTYAYGHVKLMEGIEFSLNPGYGGSLRNHIASYIPVVPGANVITSLCEILISAMNNTVGSYYNPDDSANCARICTLTALESSVYGTFNYIHVQLDRHVSTVGFMSSDGSLYHSGRWSQNGWGIHIWISDARAKHDIKDCSTSALDIINSIHHREFKYNNTNKLIDVGYIAQEMYQINDIFVTKVSNDKDPANFDPNNDATFSYQINEDAIIPYISKAVQEVDAKVVEQQKEIDDLKKENSELKESFATLLEEFKSLKKELGRE